MDNQSRDFLEKYIHNWQTAKNGYVRNLDINILKGYESIYKEYLQKDFILTAWCSGCVLDMVLRLYRLYESLPAQKNEVMIEDELFSEIEKQEIKEYVKKRGRKPKNNEKTH